MSLTTHLSGHVGNIGLIDFPCTTFLCSRVVPSQHVDTIIEWAQHTTDSSRCMVCGAQTSIEFRVVKEFLINRVPVIVVFPNSLPDVLEADWQKAVDEGRLLLLSQSEEDKPTNDAYLCRNALMLDLAQQVVVGYCARGGNISRQVAGRNDVQFLTAYSEYDQIDQTLWSHSFRMSDGGTLISNLRTQNGKSSYLELTKAFYSNETHSTEYRSIYIPQDDVQQLNNLVSDALFSMKKHNSNREYNLHHSPSPSIAAESAMPWETDIKVKVIQMHHDGLSIEKIASNLNAPRDLIEGILGVEA